jgi:hypothetical protein
MYSALKKRCDCSVHDREKSKFGKRDYQNFYDYVRGKEKCCGFV